MVGADPKFGSRKHYVGSRDYFQNVNKTKIIVYCLHISHPLISATFSKKEFYTENEIVLILLVCD